MAKLHFYKMHGLGNDFMVVNGVNQSLNFSSQQIQAWGNRHTGIGFDQLLVVEPPESDAADFNYLIFNQDGSSAEQCGNGARCIAKFIKKEELSSKNELNLLTAGKITKVTIEDKNWVMVQMAEPSFDPKVIPFIVNETAPSYSLKIANNLLTFNVVGVGNPHAITVVDEIRDTFVEDIGSELSKHSAFPKGVNVGFMQVINAHHINLRVYERGVGPTLACGSGACAAVAAGHYQGILDREVKVTQAGGDLLINWQGLGYPLIMHGPAEFVYKGEIDF